MLRLGIDPEKLYRATFICQDGLCYCNMALISFRLFRKNLGNLRDFFGQMVYRPPLAKNFPYAYVYWEPCDWFQHVPNSLNKCEIVDQLQSPNDSIQKIRKTMNKTHTTQVNQQWFLQHTTPKNTNKRAYYNRHWYGKQVWRRGESSRSVEFRRWEAS